MDWELGGKHIIRDGGVTAHRTTQDGQNNTPFWFSYFSTISNEHLLNYKEPYQTSSEFESLCGLSDFYMKGFRKSLNFFFLNWGGPDLVPGSHAVSCMFGLEDGTRTQLQRDLMN